MIITDEIDFSDYHQPLIVKGFAGIKQGRYEGRIIAVKVTQVEVTGDFEKIKKVSWKDVFVIGALTLTLFPAILQRCCPPVFAVPSEHPEARRHFGWYGARSIRHGVGVDRMR